MKPLTQYREPAKNESEESAPRATQSSVASRSGLLLASAARVAEDWQRRAADDPEASEFINLGRRFLEAVQYVSENSVSGVDPRLRSPAGRRLLQLLRTDLIRAWSEHVGNGDSGEMVSILTTLQKLDEAIDPLVSLHSLAPLTGAAGPELVVEVAHDLRSPVTSILFLSETLQAGRSGEVNELQRRQLGLIYSAALGLSTVASDLIELAQGGDRLMERKPVPFSVVEIFEAVRDITRPIAEEKQLTVRLSPISTDHRLGYPMALSRVLLNLTTNALKFTEEGTVEIIARGAGWTRVEFSVKDTGPGVRPEAFDSLYQPFRKAIGRKGFHFSGTGLGLTICRRLIRAMGSELKMETEQDRGTRFFFEIDLPRVSSV